MDANDSMSFARSQSYSNDEILLFICLFVVLSMLLTPVLLQVDRLGDKVAHAIAEEGASVDDILASLDEERERYYQDRCASD